MQSYGSLLCSDGNMPSFFSSLAFQVLLKVTMWLSPSLSPRAVTNILPLTSLLLPYYLLLVKLAAAIPDAISFAFAERAAFLVVRDTRSAVLTSLRSADAEHPLVFAQSLS